jgi:hypothetical protein
VDLELVCIHEISNECNDWVAAVESAVADLVVWRLEVDGNLDDLCKEMRRLIT